jgi:hypothetical protein
MVIQQLLADAGATGVNMGMVSVDPRGLEVPADWATLRSAENYTGYQRTEGFASPGGPLPGKPHTYTIPAQLAQPGSIRADVDAGDRDAALLAGRVGCDRRQLPAVGDRLDRAGGAAGYRVGRGVHPTVPGDRPQHVNLGHLPRLQSVPAVLGPGFDTCQFAAAGGLGLAPGSGS